jgi:hypothetical protein
MHVRQVTRVAPTPVTHTNRNRIPHNKAADDGDGRYSCCRCCCCCCGSGECEAERGPRLNDGTVVGRSGGKNDHHRSPLMVYMSNGAAGLDRSYSTTESLRSGPRRGTGPGTGPGHGRVSRKFPAPDACTRSSGPCRGASQSALPSVCVLSARSMQSPWCRAHAQTGSRRHTVIPRADVISRPRRFTRTDSRSIEKWLSADPLF